MPLSSCLTSGALIFRRQLGNKSDLPHGVVVKVEKVKWANAFKHEVQRLAYRGHATAVAVL